MTGGTYAHDTTRPARARRRPMILGLIFVIYILGPFLVYLTGGARLRGDWSVASQTPVGLAPPSSQVSEAVVQVYAARAFAWRGVFSVHTWLAVKPAHAAHYTRYEVVGWRLYRGLSPVSVSSERPPDAQWFGADPWLLRDLRGDVATAVIAALPEAVAAYPYPQSYRAWPGPNSNTFIAHLGRQLPQLRLTLPPHAVGKDYVTAGVTLTRSPSGRGLQLSLAGMLGVIVGLDEGVEVNVLALNVGIDPYGLGFSVPGLGRLGRARRP